MIAYLIKRLLLIPLTLFAIVLVNFIIINLSPGEPLSLTELSPEGTANRREDRSLANLGEDRYLQFREFYGLTLPVVLNFWPFKTLEGVKKQLGELQDEQLSVEKMDDLKMQMGDEARFVMPQLLTIMHDPQTDLKTLKLALRYFVRGGTRLGTIGPHLTDGQELANRKIGKDNSFLSTFNPRLEDTREDLNLKIKVLSQWYQENKALYHFEPPFSQKLKMLFLETRFFKYLSRVLTLDFGVTRNDPNKTVIYEVTRRMKYSLTLSVLPLIATFFLCLFFGTLMAYYQTRPIDLSLNVIFLILYAIPIFVAAPFLIEKVALNHTFPFTHTPIPFSGFTSPDNLYNQMTSRERLKDIMAHIALPLLAIMYGSLAAQARLSRTAMVGLRQDIRTAYVKGVTPFKVLVKHAGRNAAITIVTSIAGSLGIVLGGSLIVETLFEIDGFGKFFYDAILNRDYNVIMFSALAGSFLTLTGYLIADIAYMLLDPRIKLDGETA